MTSADLPAHTERAFVADADGTRQTFLLLTPREPRTVETLVIALHGHGAHQEQFLTPVIYNDALGATVRLAQAENLLYATPEYRGNSWMNAAAESDVRQVIEILRRDFPVRRVILLGGSMGGTSVLIYAALNPEGIDGVVSLCPATDMAMLYRELEHGPYDFIPEALRAGYGGTPEEQPAEYARRSSRRHAGRMTMPVTIIHGAADALLSVSHSRELVAGLRAAGTPVDYTEIADGDHDSPAQYCAAALAAMLGRLVPR
jgi:dipeptidyl aminopeptidase/acylaminoacyl peptidase